MKTRSHLFALLLAATLPVGGCAPAPDEEPGAGAATDPPVAEVSTLRSFERPFESGEREIPATVTLPAGEGEHPMVILLHGRSGLPFYGERLNALGERLAAAGIAAMIPAYFEATGDEAPAEITDPSFRAWRWVLADAVEAGAALDHVDPERIGVAGFSLGGFLAVTEAAGNPRIRAVAANYAGVSAYFPVDARRLPPLLIVHATGDPVVPVADAKALARRARELGGEVEMAHFPVETHVLDGEAWDQAAERMVEFFARQLHR